MATAASTTTSSGGSHRPPKYTSQHQSHRGVATAASTSTSSGGSHRPPKYTNNSPTGVWQQLPPLQHPVEAATALPTSHQVKQVKIDSRLARPQKKSTERKKYINTKKNQSWMVYSRRMESHKEKCTRSKSKAYTSKNNSLIGYYLTSFSLPHWICLALIMNQVKSVGWKPGIKTVLLEDFKMSIIEYNHIFNQSQNENGLIREWQQLPPLCPPKTTANNYTGVWQQLPPLQHPVEAATALPKTTANNNIGPINISPTGVWQQLPPLQHPVEAATALPTTTLQH